MLNHRFAHTMKLGFLLVFLISVPALPQTSAQKEIPKSALAGRVVKDPGSVPVKKAEVQLMAEGQEEGTNYTTTTDADGHFQIESIRHGRYRVFVERTGLVEIDKRNRRSPGTALSFEPGKDVSGLVLHLLPAAVVVGRVLDEDGDPMARTDVSVLHYGYTLGHRRLETAASGTTNDLGEYRVPDLLPGRYLAVVNPSPAFSNPSGVAASAQSAGEKEETAYVPTYYPGTTDRSQAGFLELRAGDETSVNFNLVPSATFHVRGSLAPNPGSAMLLLRPKESNAEYAAAHVDKDGKFDIGHVPPGSYTLVTVTGTAESPQLAQQMIDVTNHDINDSRILTMAGSRVRGQLHLDGDLSLDVSSLLVFLEPGDRDHVTSFFGGDDIATNLTLARVKRDGSFDLKDVPAGSYFVLVEGNSTPEYFLKSVRVGGSDVTDTGLSVGGGGTYSLDLLLGAGTARVNGGVTDADDHPVADAVVVAVPQLSRRNRLELFGKAVTDQHGRFTLTGLTPGEYQLFAFDSIEEGAYYDPGFLQAFDARGEKIRLEEKGSKTVPLKVIASSSDDR